MSIASFWIKHRYESKKEVSSIIPYSKKSTISIFILHLLSERKALIRNALNSLGHLQNSQNGKELKINKPLRMKSSGNALEVEPLKYFHWLNAHWYYIYIEDQHV